MENTETKPNFTRLAEKYNCDYRTIKRYYENRDALPHVRKKREIPLLVDQFKKLSNKLHFEMTENQHYLVDFIIFNFKKSEAIFVACRIKWIIIF